MRWNESKYRVLKYLQYKREAGQNESLTAHSLAHWAGVADETLQSHLKFWTRKCHYISRTNIKGGELRQYKKTVVMIDHRYTGLAWKGEKWLIWFESYYPELASEYLDGLQAHLDSLQVKIPDNS